MVKDSYQALGKRDVEFHAKLEVIKAKAQALVDLVPNLEAWVKLLEAKRESSRDTIKEHKDRTEDCEATVANWESSSMTWITDWQSPLPRFYTWIGSFTPSRCSWIS